VKSPPKLVCVQPARCRPVDEHRQIVWCRSWWWPGRMLGRWGWSVRGRPCGTRPPASPGRSPWGSRPAAGCGKVVMLSSPTCCVLRAPTPLRNSCGRDPHGDRLEKRGRVPHGLPGKASIPTPSRSCHPARHQTELAMRIYQGAQRAGGAARACWGTSPFSGIGGQAGRSRWSHLRRDVEGILTCGRGDPDSGREMQTTLRVTHPSRPDMPNLLLHQYPPYRATSPSRHYMLKVPGGAPAPRAGVQDQLTACSRRRPTSTASSQCWSGTAEKLNDSTQILRESTSRVPRTARSSPATEVNLRGDPGRTNSLYWFGAYAKSTKTRAGPAWARWSSGGCRSP